MQSSIILRDRINASVASGLLWLALFSPVAFLLGTVVGTASGQSTPSPTIQTQTYEGMVTDTRCMAKHSAVIGATATDCAILCVRAGEQFALVDGETSYLLEGDPVALKRVAGQRARILGTLNGKKISVSSIATAAR